MIGVEHLNGFEYRLRQMRERGAGDVNSSARRLVEAVRTLTESLSIPPNSSSGVSLLLSMVEVRVEEMKKALDEHDAMRGLQVEIDRCAQEGK